MFKNMKIFLFFICILSFVSGCTQDSKKLYNPDFKWTIFMPQGFKNVSESKGDSLAEKGREMIEKSSGIQVEKTATTIFFFADGPSNYFEANYQPFDTADIGDYLTTFNLVSVVLYNAIADSSPGIVLDSLSSEEKIDGLDFLLFKLKAHLPNGTKLDYSLY